MANASKKLIVSNQSVLIQKYGQAGFTSLQKTLQSMVQADRIRYVQTSIIYLDDAAALGASAVTMPADNSQNKKAVDAAFGSAGEPDYLMILGAPDVVPYQSLANTVTDSDQTIPSDLPYACAAPYSPHVNDFVGPTRVVGRLPDLRGGSSVKDFIDLIDSAAAASPLPATSAYFAVSAVIWQRSSELSSDKAFGDHASLLCSPPQGVSYSPGQLSPRFHFVNCHGGQANPQFYGDSGTVQQPAMDSQHLGGLPRGCVAAFECCFGAELYPAPLLGIPPSVADAYLAAGAYGVAASTNIAYGPSTSNDWADVFCAEFLSAVRSSASLGRALLQARQNYVRSKAPLSVTDLKTLAQFVLLGDPSIQPVMKADDAEPSVAAARSFDGPGAVLAAQRSQRRGDLIKTGDITGATTPVAAGPVARRPRPTPAKF